MRLNDTRHDGTQGFDAVAFGGAGLDQFGVGGGELADGFDGFVGDFGEVFGF